MQVPHPLATSLSPSSRATMRKLASRPPGRLKMPARPPPRRAPPHPPGMVLGKSFYRPPIWRGRTTADATYFMLFQVGRRASPNASIAAVVCQAVQGLRCMRRRAGSLSALCRGWGGRGHTSHGRSGSAAHELAAQAGAPLKQLAAPPAVGKPPRHPCADANGSSDLRRAAPTCALTPLCAPARPPARPQACTADGKVPWKPEQREVPQIADP